MPNSWIVAPKMLMEQAGITDYEEAKQLLLKYGSVKKALESLQ